MIDAHVPEPIIIEGKPVDQIKAEIDAHLAEGAKPEDLRMFAGRPAGPVADRFGPGDRLFGVLVV